jgi:hypothetical protein
MREEKMRITSRRLSQIIKESLEGAEHSGYEAPQPLTLADTLDALNNIQQDINARFKLAGGVTKFETAMFNSPVTEDTPYEERRSHAATLSVIKRIQTQIELVMRRLPEQDERE